MKYKIDEYRKRNRKTEREKERERDFFSLKRETQKELLIQREEQTGRGRS